MTTMSEKKMPVTDYSLGLDAMTSGPAPYEVAISADGYSVCQSRPIMRRHYTWRTQGRDAVIQNWSKPGLIHIGLRPLHWHVTIRSWQHLTPAPRSLSSSHWHGKSCIGLLDGSAGRSNAGGGSSCGGSGGSGGCRGACRCGEQGPRG